MTEKIWIPPPVIHIMKAAMPDAESVSNPPCQCTRGSTTMNERTLHWDVLCRCEGEVPSFLGPEG